MMGQENILIASRCIEKGYEFQIKGDVDKAISEYQSSIKYYPTARAHTLLGWAYSLQGKFDSAIDECYRAIEIDPAYADSYIDIGVYLIELNKLDEAIVWLEKGINFLDFQASYFAFYHLGRANEKRGDWLRAIRYYNKAISANPDFEEAQNSAIKISTLLN